jgi:hypothetical protein
MKINFPNGQVVEVPDVDPNADPEMTFLNANRRLLEKAYPGQWVAIKGAEVVGFGLSMKAAGEMAAEKGIDRPLFTAFRRLEDQGKVFLGANRRA